MSGSEDFQKGTVLDTWRGSLMVYSASSLPGIILLGISLATGGQYFFPLAIVSVILFFLIFAGWVTIHQSIKYGIAHEREEMARLWALIPPEKLKHHRAEYFRLALFVGPVAATLYKNHLIRIYGKEESDAQ